MRHVKVRRLDSELTEALRALFRAAVRVDTRP